MRRAGAAPWAASCAMLWARAAHAGVGLPPPEADVGAPPPAKHAGVALPPPEAGVGAPPPAPMSPPTTAGPAPAATHQTPEAAAAEATAHVIGRQLRCPVCQGMPISESPAPMARSMMQKVRELLAEGRSAEAIYGYFVERYGEWVLLAPPARGFNLWVWGLPPVVALAMTIAALRFMRSRTRGGVRTEPPADTGPNTPDAPELARLRAEVGQ